MPKLRGEPIEWRGYVISEYDYSCQVFRPDTGRMPRECRSYMVANSEWKYVHAPGFPPVLFDLVSDPDELVNLGESAEHATVCQTMHNLLADWTLQYRQRETWSEKRNLEMTGAEEAFGVLIGYWDESDAEGKDPKILPNRASQAAT